ncbi:hypothetical protein CsSME_00048315 [Camellia sinensis var. sinensis]
MTGESSSKVPESAAGDGLAGLLKNLGRDEILEALSDGDGFCLHCQDLLQTRILNLINKKTSELSVSSGNGQNSVEFWSANSSSSSVLEKNSQSSTKSTSWSSIRTPEPAGHSGIRNGFVNSSPASVDIKQISLNDGLGVMEEQKERTRFAQIGRKKDYVHIERIDGKATNVLQGLELHTQVFNTEEQKKIVDRVYNLQRMGQNGQLRARTYTEPKKWMRGKGRVTIQFGCCYNYAVDKNGNPPGIIRDEEVDPLPPLFKQMIQRMVRWHILPPTCVPNSCIVNIYDEGDCIPPHIDHHDFFRPFCTVSFLTECNILFGANLKILGPGEFSGPVSIALPVGSVLILNGNGADIAKHCVPGVPARRISITFRKMDDSKQPYSFAADPDLVGIKPLVYSPTIKSRVQENQKENNKITRPQEPVGIAAEANNSSIFNVKDDFPPLGSLNPVNKLRGNRYGRRQ